MSQQQDPADRQRQQTEFFGRVGSIVGGVAGRLFPRDPRQRKQSASRRRDIHLPAPGLVKGLTGVRTQARKR